MGKVDEEKGEGIQTGLADESGWREGKLGLGGGWRTDLEVLNMLDILRRCCNLRVGCRRVKVSIDLGLLSMQILSESRQYENSSWHGPPNTRPPKKCLQAQLTSGSRSVVRYC